MRRGRIAGSQECDNAETVSAPSHPFLADLAARDLIVDSTPRDELTSHLREAPRSVYIGFDPTADSLHIGNLLGLTLLRRVQLAGHRPIVLVGGGTGLIGDPSGKAGERSLNEADTVRAWAERLKRQVSRFVDFDRGTNAALLVDNYEWLSALSLIPFLRDVGKHFSVSVMLAKESVRARLATGISFTEFSYQLLQAYDFRELSRRHGCTMQMGGSDQWGNITAGIELIRRMDGASAHGLTHPLVAKADGTKFGKSETGTVWLAADKTSPYEMYQFWLNTADADVIRFLKFYTFLSLETITELEDETERAPEKREAQRVLAREVTSLVHGDEGVREAETITASLFTGDVAGLTASQLEQAFAAAPTTALGPADLGTPLVDVLVRVGLAESKRRGRELITTGAIQVNGRKVEAADAALTRDAVLPGGFVVLRKGKKTFHIARIPDAPEKNWRG
jgi:tyrosyl-tRNA synthetase